MRGMIWYDSVATGYERGIYTWDSVCVDSFWLDVWRKTVHLGGRYIGKCVALFQRLCFGDWELKNFHDIPSANRVYFVRD
jgi:hypothetical protein